MVENYALVTGASRGLGKHLALSLAKRGYHLLLTSLPNERIDMLAESIKKKGCKVYYLEIDLTKKENILKLVRWIHPFPVSVLVNNAGCGGSESICSASVASIETIIQLNITATALVTKLLIPTLIQQPKSYILNVSSMAAFSPIGYKTVYPASKKFIDFFSRGLQEELKSETIRISVMYPGPMKTNEDVTQRLKKQSKLVNYSILELDAIADIAISGLLKGKKIIIPGVLNKMSRLALLALPSKIKTHLLTKAMKKELDR